MRVEHGGPIEMWGGIECTLNRVGDRYFDQLALSGHATRLSDLDAIAALGIKRLRYPVLWELTAPSGVADWSWAQRRLSRLRELGIAPIVGFVHHGSGPRHTSLLDPAFARGLGNFAAQFAERFPWVDAYTPVNEPLTTARFSALYGTWYPHATDDRSFVRALLTQCEAVATAMRAIRRVNAAAELVQTDDLGTVSSTPRLSYQAAFENERRWVTWDLLCGLVDRDHPLRGFLEGAGAQARELDSFCDNPCPPDIVGINHYVTSDRFLHERPELFPERARGGNGRDVYADIESVRVSKLRERPLRDLLAQAWRRYRRPIAVTEAHMGCTREEQLRWLHEIWREAHAARELGSDVRAVTAWALFGSFNWNSLVTADSGYYEPGAFDVRSGTPRRTAVARLIRALSGGGAPGDIAREPGWWRRSDRFLCSDLSPGASAGTRAPRHQRPRRPAFLIAGAGTLGTAFARACARRGLSYRLCTRRELDLCDGRSIASALLERPSAVINAAGYVRVDDAEREPALCRRDNCLGANLLATACARHDLPLATFSSDLVFDGSEGRPYSERDAARPLNVYGRSKVDAERSVRLAHRRALVIRTSAFFGPWDEHNFLTTTLSTLARGGTATAIDDIVVSPTYLPNLVDATLDLVLDREGGLWHLANQGAVSWAAFAERAAALAGVSLHNLRRLRACDARLVARRPAYSALTSERGLLLPPLEHALESYIDATSAERGRLAASTRAPRTSLPPAPGATPLAS